MTVVLRDLASEGVKGGGPSELSRWICPLNVSSRPTQPEAAQGQRPVDRILLARWRRKLVGWPILAGVVLAALGAFPTRAWAGRDGLIAMSVMIAVVLVITCVTLSRAMTGMARSAENERLQVAFRAGLERFVATLVVAGLLAWRSELDTRTLLVWTAISYVVMLTVELLALLRWISVIRKGTCE